MTDPESEPLLEGQRVFKGPRQVRQNLITPLLRSLSPFSDDD